MWRQYISRNDICDQFHKLESLRAGNDDDDDELRSDLKTKLEKELIVYRIILTPYKFSNLSMGNLHTLDI